MFMNSNGPVSTRRAFTRCATGSVVRSETQLHILPFSSGCIERRNTTVFSLRSKISAWAYSVNRLGQSSTSLVMSHTISNGALITIELSVWTGMFSPRLLEATIGIVDRFSDSVDLTDIVVRDRKSVPLLDFELNLNQCEGIQTHGLK